VKGRRGGEEEEKKKKKKKVVRFPDSTDKYLKRSTPGLIRVGPLEMCQARCETITADQGTGYVCQPTCRALITTKGLPVTDTATLMHVKSASNRAAWTLCNPARANATTFAPLGLSKH